jgi:mannose-6-phosphate isomerase-like protein (cupin superfamily)
MSIGDRKNLATAPMVLAPDGSEVRILAACSTGSMAQFRLQQGQASAAVAHHTVEELWFVTDGQGEIWRKSADDETVTDLKAGTSLSIPKGVAFQFRNTGAENLNIIGVTMPPWPGADEAYFVQGKW